MTVCEHSTTRLIVLKQHTGETIDGPKDTLMLCPPYVYGYYLNMRCWCQLFVDSVKPVRWEPAAFDSVIMDDAQKETLRSLVRQHRFIGGTRDETELKGKGLAIALHGPPGTGKTFTAGEELYRSKTGVQLYLTLPRKDC